MVLKKKKKWYSSPLILTLISLIGDAILSIIPTYYFTIRQEKIEYSKIENSISSAESLLSQGMADEALKAYSEVISKVSKDVKPEFYARIKTGEGKTYFLLASKGDQESNLKKSLTSYSEALKIFTIKDYPADYAKTQSYIANSFLFMSEIRDRKGNLELSINANLEALKIFSL